MGVEAIYQAKLLNFQLNSSSENFINEEKQAENDLNQNNSNQLLTLQDLKAKISSILSKANNDPETERDFRKTCYRYENQSSISFPSLSQAYYEYVSIYHHITSLYLITEDDRRTILTIYNTESERTNTEVLEISGKFDHSTCIAQLPNAELFCFGSGYPITGTSCIIDINYKARSLPSGPPCGYSSAIYFNRSVYCFGGRNVFDYLTVSSRFDLDRNQWFKLTPMPKADLCCHSVIFKGNILISGWLNNIWLYSIDIDSFSEIPYEFGYSKIKILINRGKLYLIENSIGKIYESKDEYDWNQIANAIIGADSDQIYCIYNKGWIYNACYANNNINYYKFNLNEKFMINLP